MTTDTCTLLMEALTELSRLYPELRLGQLVEMIALLANEDSPMRAADVEDDRFVDSAAHHMRVRRDQLMIETTPPQDRDLPESRTELLDELQRAWERHRDYGFGPLVDHLASLSASSLYDVDDQQLTAAAREYPASEHGANERSRDRAERAT
jgi:hypothetical protein